MAEGKERKAFRDRFIENAIVEAMQGFLLVVPALEAFRIGSIRPEMGLHGLLLSRV